jgi:hypothetical protein
MIPVQKLENPPPKLGELGPFHPDTLLYEIEGPVFESSPYSSELTRFGPRGSILVCRSAPLEDWLGGLCVFERGGECYAKKLTTFEALDDLDADRITPVRYIKLP